MCGQLATEEYFRIRPKRDTNKSYICDDGEDHVSCGAGQGGKTEEGREVKGGARGVEMIVEVVGGEGKGRSK